jgi:hypothetical protein
MALASLDRTSLNFSPEEERASEAILEVMQAIRDLYGGKNPCNFENEVIPAIHTLQQFVQQHWAHRIYPEEWSDWTHPDDD